MNKSYDNEPCEAESIREETKLERIIERLSEAEHFITDINTDARRLRADLIGEVPEDCNSEKTSIQSNGKIGTIENKISNIFRMLEQMSSVVYDLSKTL